MNIRSIVDNLKKPFEKGQKLEKFYPAFDAFETFLFVPDHTTKSGSHIRDAIDLKRSMMTVIIALLPALFFGMWNIGNIYYNSLSLEVDFFSKFSYGALKMLPLILVSYIVGLTVEFAFAIYRGHQVNDCLLYTSPSPRD